jgi:thioredoxin-like negative regulator of GroEL
MVKYIENMDMFNSEVIEASKSKLVVVDFTASWCVARGWLAGIKRMEKRGGLKLID